MYGDKYTIGSKWKLKEQFFYGQMYAENIEDKIGDNHVHKEIGKKHGFILDNSWNLRDGHIICEWIIPKNTVLEIKEILPMYGHMVDVNGVYLQFCDIEDLNDILERVETEE